MNRPEELDAGLIVVGMTRHGFQNYFREWWHYQFNGGAAAATHDVPIGRR